MVSLFARTCLVWVLGSGSMFAISAQESDAEASGLVLSSGVEGGGYWSAAARLQTVADKMRFAVENRPSTGSLENLEELLDADSPVNLAFAQADATRYYLNRNEDEIKKLDLLENIGEECIFMLTGADSGIRTDEDLRDTKDLQLGIASATSGVAATFDYMVTQIPELIDVKVNYGDTLPHMEKLTARKPPVDAVMMIHRPKEHSPEVDYALANADRYRFVELSDDLFTQELWNGRRVYRSMSLAMPGLGTPVKTICVTGLLLANKQKLSLEQRNQLSDLVSYHWMEVYATQ